MTTAFLLRPAKIFGIAGLFIVLQYPSLRALFKYLPAHLYWLAFVYLALTFLIYWYILSAGRFALTKWNWLNKRGTTIILILFILTANYLVYPIADSLKLQGKGSDQDDALIVTAKNLLSGKYPYEARTYHPGNPISAGPGWIILNMVFSLKGLYFLLTPFYILLLVLLLRKISGGFYLSNLFILLCMSSLAFWETMVVGSDMFAIGALFVLCLCGTFLSQAKPKVLFLWMLLFGFALTSRVVFLYLALVVAILMWRSSGAKNLVYLLIALMVALGLHSLFYYWSPAHYDPLHLLSKGSGLLTPILKILCIFTLIASVIYAFFKATNKLTSWLLMFFLCLAIPLIFVSFGDLMISRQFHLADWEGANYLIVPIPVFLTYFVLRYCKDEKI